ncbi:glycoside hydrolase family 2 protein [Paenibacillus methanolicus]|uniref:beta-mannosidase n=1 Tax=Paenibacillus methanolicus TaxID=582686 RepID=A0A5S5C8B2_9BACL|nr:glycoside hydrolase family 2 TIM barrel-domain containing protein [Paenibacillus methanolicus]TYP74722.1 beta-mannosidase [Paenibacillus methanolicus]
MTTKSAMEWNLGGEGWELKGFWPWVPLKGTSMEIGNELMGVTDWMSATVPGGVHHDLYRAGLLANPYQDLNSLQAEWVENRWWVYRKKFRAPSHASGTMQLICRGLDYEAMVYWNGALLGEHKGMYEAAAFDVTDHYRAEEEVELLVVFKQAPDEMGQIGRTSETFTQKSRFNYKWDFSTRLVNVGIWDDIVLAAKGAYSLGELSVTTDVQDESGQGLIRVESSVERNGRAAGESEAAADSPAVIVKLYAPDGALSQTKRIVPDDAGRARCTIAVEAPLLWYPSGYGDQPLYRVELTLADDAREYDSRSLRTGIRKLEYMQNEGSPADALPYTFVVNGRKVYVKGANLTPLDHMYGNVTDERYSWMARLAKEGNLNLLRIWGGGIIEKSALYDLCDEHGILIWQEFIQSSSGIDNEPSKRPEFLPLLARNAVAALKDRRNHVSLTVWSGGNELMSAPNVPSTFADENLAMLRELVRLHDPGRLFLPTSASGPVQYITEERGVSHDVHGHWKYMGNPDHYRIYGQADHLFHSEFGVDGLSGVKSIRKFIGEAHRKPVPMKDSLVWRHHGEWWDTFDRDTTLFGKMTMLSLFADCSQWIQAEGLRYILDANRRRKFNNSGSIIWQLNEPWPNVTCTNLVDYYMEPKMAYYWVREAFRGRRASLDYARLDCSAIEAMSLPVYVATDGESAECLVCAEVLDSAGAVLHGQAFQGCTSPDKTLLLGSLSFQAPETADGLFYVRLTLTVNGEEAEQSGTPYIFSTRPAPIYAPALSIAGGKLAAEALGEWVTDSMDSATTDDAVHARDYAVKNTGDRVLLHVYPIERADLYWTQASDAYFTLFPGEERIVRVTCRKRTGELFAESSTSAADDAQGRPRIEFVYFNAAAAANTYP